MGSGVLAVDAMATGCLGAERRGERFFVLSHFWTTLFCIWQPCTLDSGNKIAASAHGMGAGDLAVDAMSIGCLGVDRSERFFELSIF
jgi:hypothetical protein